MERRSLSDSILLLLAISIGLVLLLPALFMDGMFMDGLLYTCVGKNLAAGKGTFWDPYFSATYLTSFHEQPPLKFAMEAIFYRVLGNSFLTERLFCLTMCAGAFFALRMIWRSLFVNELGDQKLFWLPVLMFFVSPVTFYAFTNNVEEGTMVVFALFSVAFILRGIYTMEKSNLWFVLGGIMLLCSSLCKGFQGLFPLVTPMVWWLCVRNITFRKAVLASVIVTLIPVAFYALISLYEPAYTSYVKYFDSRFYAAFHLQSAATTENRFFLLYELFLDLLPILAIAVVLVLISRKDYTAPRKIATALLLVGMAGILPLMVTLEQRGFYLVTGLPFVTSAIAVICIPGARKLRDAIEIRPRLRMSLLIVGIVVLSGTLVATVSLAGKPKRDVAMIADVKLIASTCGDNSVVSTDANTFAIWSLQCYLMRYHDISVSANDTSSKYYIVPEGVAAPPGYSKVPIKTTQFHLWSK